MLVRVTADAIRSNVGLSQCPSLPNASRLSDFDVVKHVLFGSVPLPASDCNCFSVTMSRSTRGNLGIVKSVLTDPSCVSCSAYTEVSEYVTSSTSLVDVSEKLLTRFRSNAANSKDYADLRFCQELEKIAGTSPSPTVPCSAASISLLLSSAGQHLLETVAPLCAFAQRLYHEKQYWLVLQHVMFSAKLLDGVADCDCVVKQSNKNARLMFVKEMLKPWQGKSFADARHLVSTAAVHLAELAHLHGSSLNSSHSAVRVHLQDESAGSKFLPFKLDPLLVAREGLIRVCCSFMWTALNTPDKLQLLLLHGVSGVGKTSTAVASIHKLQKLSASNNCDILIQHINGRGAVSVMAGFLNLGLALSRRLDLSEIMSDDEVAQKLIAHLKFTRYVIFLDDADMEGMLQLIKLLPHSTMGCCVILTSRQINAEDGQRIATDAGFAFCDEFVQGFSLSESMECLRACRVPEEYLSNPNISNIVAVHLLHLPQAVRVFGYWLKQKWDRTVAAEDILAEFMKEMHLHSFGGLDPTSLVRLALSNLRCGKSSNSEAQLQLLSMLVMCPTSVSWSLFHGMGLLAHSEGILSELQDMTKLPAIADDLQKNTFDCIVTVDVHRELFLMQPNVQDIVFSELCSESISS
jgi:hypothetical protein